MKEKKYLIITLSIVLLTLVGTTYAYFSSVIVGDKKNITVDMAELKIIFTNGDAIEASDVYAEDNLDIVKTFSVENKTRNEYKYNIVIEDLVNTFKTTGYLVYKITSDDGGYNMTDFEDVPKSLSVEDVILANYINIPARSIHTYTIEIKYINSEIINQNKDLGAKLNGKIFISRGTRNLSHAILEDNPTISSRSDFTQINSSNTTGTIYRATTNQSYDNSEIYYYSGNTTNNWMKILEPTICTYNRKEVTYVSDFNNRLVKKSNITESECTSTNVCNLNDKYYYVGLSEEECVQVGGTLTTNDATYVHSDKATYWRIIKMNMSESYSPISLLYSGTGLNTTEGYIASSKFNENADDPMYVGYMYGTSGSLENNRTNDNKSTIYKTIIEWLQNHHISSSNILDFYYDRSVPNNDYSLTNSFNYGTYTRLTNFNPSFVIHSDGQGNILDQNYEYDSTYRSINVGLITADEIALAGGVLGKDNPNAWYNTNANGKSITNGSSWWTISPKGFNIVSDGSSTLSAFNYSITGKGAISENIVTEELYIRPVIIMAGTSTTIYGSGTPENPYEIDYENTEFVNLKY